MTSDARLISGSLLIAFSMSVCIGKISSNWYTALIFSGSPSLPTLSGIVPARPGGNRCAVNWSCVLMRLIFTYSSLVATSPTGIILTPSGFPFEMVINMLRKLPAPFDFSIFLRLSFPFPAINSGPWRTEFSPGARRFGNISGETWLRRCLTSRTEYYLNNWACRKSAATYRTYE